MKIVLDMNVFVSAFYFEGNPKLVLERVIEGIDETYVSKGMNEEIFSVMIRPKFKTDIEYVEHFIKSIEDISIGVRTKEKLKGVSEDIKDGKILECALEAKAEYIVTGDKDLLSLKSFKNIKISSPENYLKIVNKE
ncbi:MAG: putative toxin-antitoxin system toxin component, PIN family [Endomicrobium sp.]|jgi:putative PIN family toxin of toxin-antitoxin system|nr:putative toxin-antitoxin system toxin component, PIN family [Endomicrobium sp.]